MLSPPLSCSPNSGKRNKNETAAKTQARDGSSICGLISKRNPRVVGQQKTEIIENYLQPLMITDGFASWVLEISS